MNMVIPDEGKVLWIESVFSTAGAGEAFHVDLFSSNTTVGDSSTGADFTIATFTGYAQVSIARADFDPATITSHVAELTDPTYPTFTCSGGSPQTVYGWIMRGATSGKIYAGQNFDSPRVMAAGATEQLNPFTISFKTFA